MRRVSPPLRIVIVPAGTAKPFDENWIVTLLVATAPSTRRCGPSTVCASPPGSATMRKPRPSGSRTSAWVTPWARARALVRWTAA